MEKRGIIEASSSPYSAPIVLVPKTNSSYRFCADFRALSSETLSKVLALRSVRNVLIPWMDQNFSRR